MVHGISLAGKGVWTFVTKARVESSPAIADGRVFRRIKRRTILCSERRQHGAKVWEFTAGAPLSASPAIASGPDRHRFARWQPILLWVINSSSLPRSLRFQQIAVDRQTWNLYSRSRGWISFELGAGNLRSSQRVMRKISSSSPPQKYFAIVCGLGLLVTNETINIKIAPRQSP